MPGMACHDSCIYSPVSTGVPGHRVIPGRELPVWCPWTLSKSFPSTEPPETLGFPDRTVVGLGQGHSQVTLYLPHLHFSPRQSRAIKVDIFASLHTGCISSYRQNYWDWRDRKHKVWPLEADTLPDMGGPQQPHSKENHPLGQLAFTSPGLCLAQELDLLQSILTQMAFPRHLQCLPHLSS